ncbi:MAG: YceI family protein [Bacteroidota bacterium]|nr:YceI family protein [Bacteroidota bacterium]MEC8033330.1 YceI family protein [Bacteroidota bacterium]
MKYIFALFTTCILGLSLSYGQLYSTSNGEITFYSHAPLEDIEATNKQVSCAIDLSKGQMAFSMLMNAFQFEKALMQEHFNERYVESHKYPKATFAGSIEDIDKIDLSKAGSYNVTVSGKLSIHGVTQTVSSKGTLKIGDDKTLTANSTFTINLEDYKVKIPTMYIDNISESIEIKVKVKLKPKS